MQGLKARQDIPEAKWIRSHCGRKGEPGKPSGGTKGTAAIVQEEEICFTIQHMPVQGASDLLAQAEEVEHCCDEQWTLAPA